MTTKFYISAPANSPIWGTAQDMETWIKNWHLAGCPTVKKKKETDDGNFVIAANAIGIEIEEIADTVGWTVDEVIEFLDKNSGEGI